MTGYVKRVADEFGQIDILVDNAALLGGKGVLDESAEFFSRAVQVAAMGNFAAMDLAPYGIRVNSFTPTAPTPDNPVLIAERGAGGVLDRPRRNGIGGATGDEEWRRQARWTGERPPMVPMGTTGTPTDIGHCVAWLCSDYARLITGCDLVVDGGARARRPSSRDRRR